METIILAFIQNVENTSKNVRYIVVLMALASIISFIGIWNSMEANWMQKRIQFYDYQIKWHNCFENKKLEDSLIKVHKTDKELVEKYYKIKSYYSEHNYSEEVLKDLLLNLKINSFQNIYLIKIPIIGVAFDINDIGLISGATFSIILIVLLFSIIFKHNQVKKTYDIIKYSHDSNKIEYLKLLLMNQVLTNDKIKMHDNINQFKKIIKLRSLPLILYAVPAAIHIFIFIFDLSTLSQGELLNYNYSIIICILSGFFSLLIIILTTFVFINLSRVDFIWKKIHLYMQSLEEESNKKEIS